MSNTSNTPPEDGFEFIRKMWGGMGFGLPGMATPTMDVDELERRITDLKAVEGWLKMNLGMLQMTIQGLEVQRSTLAAMQAMSQTARDNPDAVNPFANPALWTWPFASQSSGAAAEDASSGSSTPNPSTTAAEDSPSKAASGKADKPDKGPTRSSSRS